MHLLELWWLSFKEVLRPLVSLKDEVGYQNCLGNPTLIVLQAQEEGFTNSRTQT